MDAPVARATVNIVQAMKLVGVSRRTIYYWLAAHKVEQAPSVGASVRIYTDTLWRTARAAAAFRNGEP